MSYPSPVVRSLPGYKMSWSVTGTLPIYTAIARNSTVLFNTTESTGHFALDVEGNYSLRAINQFGSDVKAFSVIFTGETAQKSKYLTNTYLGWYPLAHALLA